MLTHPKTLRQHGLSLLEVLLSLSIIAIILIMATRYFFVASHNDKVNTTVSQIGGLIAAVHNYKSIDPNYPPDISIETLAEAGQLVNFPGFDGKKNFKTMWGDDISITTDDNHARVTVTVNLPDNMTCKAIHHAFPTESKGLITAGCSDKTFVYTFP